MINKNAFRSITYGLYLIASSADGKMSGCTVNTFSQVTSDPFQASVVLNKENFTCEIIQKAGKYTATVLSQGATMELIGNFGFHSSREKDKFQICSTKTDDSGLPYVLDHAVSRFSVEVTNSIDMGTHIMFIGTVTEAEVLSDQDPMTYAYYHVVKGGKTPPRASSYIPEGEDTQKSSASQSARAWRCTICGHIEYMDELPEDYVCPICGAGREFFELVEDGSV